MTSIIHVPDRIDGELVIERDKVPLSAWFLMRLLSPTNRTLNVVATRLFEEDEVSNAIREASQNLGVQINVQFARVELPKRGSVRIVYDLQVQR
jgi:hypothetical protein